MNAPWARPAVVDAGIRAAACLVAVVLAATVLLGNSERAVAAESTPMPPVGTPPPTATPPAAVRWHTEHVPVLMYHRITCAPRDAAYPELWVCPSVFDATMRRLKAAGWDTITSHQLAMALRTGTAVPPRLFVLVFDDGDRDGYDHAYPILEKYGFEGVFAVVVGRVQVRRQAMTWAELRELETAGHEIADHSASHAWLAHLPHAGLVRQIETSAAQLCAHLGHRPTTFVYPFGAWDQRVVAQVRASGFRIAYTTAYGARERHGGRFVSPRIRINRSDSPADVIASCGRMLTGAGPTEPPMPDRPHSTSSAG